MESIITVPVHYDVMKIPCIDNNRDVIDTYVISLELLDLKDTSIITRVHSLVPFFKFLECKKAEDIAKPDIEKYITFMRRSPKKKVTQNRDIINLRAFFNWLKPDNDFFNNIKIKREKPDYSKKEFVTSSDVLAMLPHCTNQRDRVLLMLMWESGARLGEMLAIDLGDVKPHKYGVTITVAGKTGQRDILIIDSIPDLQQWINIYKADSNAPLFPILSRRCEGRLGSRGAEYVIKALAEKAGIEKRIWCHGCRHGRLTELSNAGMSEMQLRHFAGWANTSDQPATYLHATQADVFDRLARIKGIEIDEDAQEPIKIMSKKSCPRCSKENAFDAKYCSGCSLVLDQKTALEMEKVNNKLDLEFLESSTVDPALLKLLAKELKNIMEDKK
jgi:site-specific recombinase XerD